MQPTLPFDEPTSGAARVVTCRPSAALDALAAEVDRAKDGDRLASVTIIVATNIAGVLARRALGRRGGVLGIDVVTLGRVAELIAGPSLAAERRQPVSNPLLEVTIADVLAEAPGLFERVADHPTTVTALRSAHQEIRLAGDDGARTLAGRGRRSSETVRVSRSVTARLQRRWYDEADVIQRATDMLADGAPAGLERVVVWLPQWLDTCSASFLRRLTNLVPTTVLSARTGSDHADGGAVAATVAITDTTPTTADDTHGDDGATSQPAPIRVVSTTDAEDEVRIAVRTVVDAARGALTGQPVPFERIGIFWPTHVPYARLLEHHLTADGVPWNGRGGTAVVERIAPRLLLDLLDVDQRRFRRTDLFDLLADVPARDGEGRFRPTAEWLRLTRAAGISEDPDWLRLRSWDDTSSWASTAAELADFVDDLRARLGHPDQRRTWREWSEWCDDQLHHWLGPRAEIRLSDAEYRAWEALMSVLDRLRSLDAVVDPPGRRRFRSVLDAELRDVSVREGRIGTGVVTGSLAGAAGLDLDVAVVLGATDGILPPPPHADPLLTDDDRRAAGLAAADERARQLHHALRSVLDSCSTVVTMPRGDLRATTEHRLTRWLEDAVDADRIEIVASAIAGLETLDFAPCDRERRLRDRLRSGVPADPALAERLGDPVLSRAVALHAGRQSDTFTEFDGDLTSVEVPRLGDRPVSPTQIQTWASCPHAYFTRYLLGVRPIEDVDRQLEIRPLDIGNIQHAVLDLLHRDVLAGRLPQPIAGWTDEHRAAVLEHFDAVCEHAERRGRTGRPATWFALRRRFRTELLTWMDRDSAITAAHGAEILRSEFSFGADRSAEERDEAVAPARVHLADGRALPFTGSADRIDRWADGTVVVTDHKTGKDTFRALSAENPTLDGTVFQLPAYAAAAASLTSSTGPIRAEYSLFGRGDYQRRGITFTDEAWERVAADLSHVVDGIETGWFPLLPEAPGFRVYVACEHCDPDGIGTDDVHAAWHRKRHDPRAARWFGEPDAEGSADTDGGDP